MKRFAIFLSILLFSRFLFACDAIGGYSSREIPVKQNISFNGPQFTVSDASSRQNNTEFEFAANQIFTSSTMDYELKNVMSNLGGGEIRSIDLRDISLTCTSNGSGAIVKELKLSAVGNNVEKWELPAMDCSFGVPVQHAGLNNFLQRLIHYNLSDKNVRVTATGWTDAPAGTRVDITITAYLNRLKIRIYTGA